MGAVLLTCPFSPWHDLPLLIEFLRAFCAFNCDWRATTLPSLPPSSGGRVGRPAWGGGWGRREGGGEAKTAVQSKPTRRNTSLSRPPVQRRHTPPFWLRVPDSKVSRHDVDAFLRFPSTAERRTRSPLSVRCPLHRCQCKNLTSVFSSPTTMSKRCLSLTRMHTAHFPRPSLLLQQRPTRTHTRPSWSVCPPQRSIFEKKGESFQLSNHDSKVSRHNATRS